MVVDCPAPVCLVGECDIQWGVGVQGAVNPVGRQIDLAWNVPHVFDVG